MSDEEIDKTTINELDVDDFPDVPMNTKEQIRDKNRKWVNKRSELRKFARIGIGLGLDKESLESLLRKKGITQELLNDIFKEHNLGGRIRRKKKKKTRKKKKSSKKRKTKKKC